MFDLPESITIWTPTKDAFGQVTWSAPIVADARIALKQEKFTDSNGDQQLSVAVCYADATEFIIDAQVFFGVSTELTPVDAANDLKQVSQVPSGSGDLKKGWF